jgi:succinoglycan biosynthesis protein ExoM
VKVDVCIATFRRPQLLATLLRSLAMQKLPDSTELRVIVVDNDAVGSARPVVTEAGANLRVDYVIEPSRGIASARARCLGLVQGEFFAFIDDDEHATPDWLGELLATQARFQADAVFGPVLPVLEPGGPRWVPRGRFFDRPRHPTGHRVQTGATNNVLVSTTFVRHHGIEFDRTITGPGEDTDFFARLWSAGARMVWCDSAVVLESVPIERQNLRWLVHRAYASGKAYAGIYPPARRLGHRLAWVAKRTVFAAGACVATPFALLLRKDVGVRSLQKAAANLGQLAGALAPRPSGATPRVSG